MILSQILKQTINSFPNRGISYLRQDGSRLFQSYFDMSEEAKKFLFGLRQIGLQPKDKIILAMSDYEKFTAAFWGSIYGGILPVLLPSFKLEYVSKELCQDLYLAWSCIKPSFIVVDSKKVTSQVLFQNLVDKPQNKILYFEEIIQDSTSNFFYFASNEDPAFTYFSVNGQGEHEETILTHKNTFNIVDELVEKTAKDIDDIFLSWMSPSNYIELIGFHLRPIYSGNNQYHLDTKAFIKQPISWLNNLSKYNITVTSSTHNSNNLLLKYLELQQNKKWDLSAVRLILNMGQTNTLSPNHQLLNLMSLCKLNLKSITPMCEFTVPYLNFALSSIDEITKVDCFERSQLQENNIAALIEPRNSNAIYFADVDSLINGHETRIVNSENELVAENVVGAIQIRENTKNRIYSYEYKVNQTTYCKSWIHTNKVGFISNDRLYIVGNSDEKLLINNTSYYIRDLENIVRSIKELQTSKIAISSFYSEIEERDLSLLFIASSKPDISKSKFIEANRKLKETAGINIDKNISIHLQQFPKANSISLQRYKLRNQFMEGLFDKDILEFNKPIPESAISQHVKTSPKTTTEKILHKLWCEVLLLQPEEIGIHDRFEDLGGESFKALKVLHKLSTQYNISLNLMVLVENRTISKISTWIDKHPSITQSKRQTFTG